MSVKVHITTTLNIELHDLAREQRLKWSDCLAAGIKLLSGHYTEDEINSYESKEAKIIKLERVKGVMETEIQQLNEKMEKKHGHKRFP